MNRNTSTRTAIAWGTLGAIFLLCVLQVMRVSLAASPVQDDRKVVRIGHYLLQSGLREAIDAVAAEYERAHPDVRIVQAPIPERVYLQFLRTQLVGGTAPDILQLGGQFTGMEEMRARYFFPITSFVEKPNPYNSGTTLEDQRWRETFLDGLQNTESYSEASLQYYAVPLTLSSLRIFYNKSLLKTLTGREEPPATFDELRQLCQLVKSHVQAGGKYVVPFAGSRLSALFLMSPLFSSVNQRLYYDLAGDHSLQVSDWGYGLAFLRGRWNFDHSSIRLGYQIAREMAEYQKTGFSQLGPTDALMQFLQGESLMLVSLTTEITNVRDLAKFQVAVTRIPVPTPDDPVFGGGIYGPVTEFGNNAVANFGVNIAAPHREEALDFLRFLTSKRTMELFVERSSWLPSVTDVKVPGWMEPLRPLEGYAGSFFGAMWGRGDARMVSHRHVHLLFSPLGGVEAYLRAIENEYAPAMRIDLAREVHEANLTFRRQEPAMLGQFMSGEGTEAYWRDVSSQNSYESRMLQTAFVLATEQASKPPGS